MFKKINLDFVGNKIRSAHPGWIFWLILALAVVIRLALLPIPNTDNDIAFQTWSRVITMDGIHTIYDVYDPIVKVDRECQYPPMYLYVLWASGKVYQHFFSPVFVQESILFLIILRLPLVLADLALAILLFMVLRRWSGIRIAHIAFAVYALSPAMILDSTIVTQIDSVQVLLMVGTILLLVSGKDTLAIVCLAVAVLTKLQAVILVPLVLFTVAQRGHWRSLVRGAAISTGIFLLLTLPFILHGRIYQLFRVLLTPVGTAPFLSLNAFNAWWLISGGHGWQPDSVAFLGFVTPRLIGLVLLVAAVALGLYRIRIDSSRDSVILVAAFTCLVFFMVCTEMTERYILPTLPLLLLLAPGKRRFVWLYGLLSVTIFINLYTVFPLLRLSPLDALRLPHSNFYYYLQPQVSIRLSVLNLAPGPVLHALSLLVSLVHVAALVYLSWLAWPKRNRAVLPTR